MKSVEQIFYTTRQLVYREAGSCIHVLEEVVISGRNDIRQILEHAPFQQTMKSVGSL
jgi:hypothetical protein